MTSPGGGTIGMRFRGEGVRKALSRSAVLCPVPTKCQWIEVVHASGFPKSILSVPTSYRIQQLFRVVADTVLEYDLHFLNILNPPRGIALDDDQVSILSNRNRSNLLLPSQIARAVQGGNLDRFERRKSCLNQ